MDEIDWDCAPMGTQRFVGGDNKYPAKWLKMECDGPYGWEASGDGPWRKIVGQEWYDLNGNHGRLMLKPPVPLDEVAKRNAIVRMIEDSDYSILECQAEILYERGYRRIAQ